MAKSKQSQAGEEHFEDRAKVFEETSDDSRFSTTSVTLPAQNGNGAVSTEVRGAPSKDKK
jgi:hypothetical protein